MKERKINLNPPSKKGISIKALEKLLTKWQKKLGMQDWALDIKIVDFERKDFRQSGDFVADIKKRKATIYLTWNPFRDEEYTLVHEIIHVLVYSFDSYVESLILEKHKEGGKEHRKYLNQLEDLVHHMTFSFLGRRELNLF